MINYKENYNKWLEDNFFDEETREELSNLIDEKEIEDRFYRDREIWFDPLGKIFGGWGLYEDGQFTTESIENFMLFVPFSILLLWAFQKELLDESENIRFGKTVWEATKVVAVYGKKEAGCCTLCRGRKCICRMGQSQQTGQMGE